MSACGAPDSGFHGIKTTLSPAVKTNYKQMHSVCLFVCLFVEVGQTMLLFFSLRGRGADDHPDTYPDISGLLLVFLQTETFV